MTIRRAIFSKRLMEFTLILLPPCMFRAIGIRMRINATGKSHNMPNKTMGKPSWYLHLLTNSRIINGSTRIELMIIGNLRIVKTLLIMRLVCS